MWFISSTTRFKCEIREFIGEDCSNMTVDIEKNLKHKKTNYQDCILQNWDNCVKYYMIESAYWEWVMYKFQDEFVSYYGYEKNDKALKAWSKLTKSQVLNTMQQQMMDFHSSAYFWRAKKTVKYYLTSHAY